TGLQPMVLLIGLSRSVHPATPEYSDRGSQRCLHNVIADVRVSPVWQAGKEQDDRRTTGGGALMLRRSKEQVTETHIGDELLQGIHHLRTAAALAAGIAAERL